MDLRAYYQKIRQLESEMKQPQVVVVSHETADGGKAGVRSEVPRGHAARLVVEGRARLATPEESADFQKEKREAYERAQQEALSARVQVAILPESEIRTLRGSVRPQKS